MAKDESPLTMLKGKAYEVIREIERLKNMLRNVETDIIKLEQAEKTAPAPKKGKTNEKLKN